MFEDFYASCECGSLEYRFSTAIPPLNWQVRKCTCSFCTQQRKHLHVSDPLGQVEYKISVLAHLNRYQFSTNSYLGAVMNVGNRVLAVLNAEIINLPITLPEPIIVSFDGETANQRVVRRIKRWTPVVGKQLMFN